MDPGFNLAGTAIQAGADMIGTHLTNTSNARIAKRQMDFQERMSSTAYQRAKNDMEAAGLNPILAYTQGGASTPQGASYQHQNVVGRGVSSAREAAMSLATIDNLRQQNLKLQSETALTNQLRRVAQQDEVVKANTAESISYDNVGKQVDAVFDQTYPGIYLNIMKKLVDSISPFRIFGK